MRLTKKQSKIIDSLFELDKKYGIPKGRLDNIGMIGNLQEYIKLKEKENLKTQAKS